MNEYSENPPKEASLTEATEKEKGPNPLTSIQEEEGFKENTDAQEVNPFPVHAMPEPCQRFIREHHEATGFPSDFTGLAMLVALSALIGNTFKLKVKGGWEVPPILWGIIIGKPGIGKSPALTEIFKPLEELQNEFYEDYRREKEEYEQQEEPKGTPPKRKQLLIKDHTPESLADIAEAHPKGSCVKVQEALNWTKSFDRYNDGGALELWLDLFDGGSLDIKRRKEDKRIPKPFFSVIGGIQTDKLHELFSKGKDSNGFTDRMLFAYPDEQDYPEWSEEEVSERTMNEWRDLVQELHGVPYNKDSQILSIPAEAKELWKEWFNKKQGEKRSADEASGEPGRIAKIVGYVPRLALILHLATHSSQSETPRLSRENLQAAIELAEYFQRNAERVREKAKQGAGFGNKELIRALRERGKSQSEIADAVGVTQQRVSKALKQVGC